MPKEAVARTMPCFCLCMAVHGGMGTRTGWFHGTFHYRTASHLCFLWGTDWPLTPNILEPRMTAVQPLIWTYNNIVRYGGDPERLYVGGHSAGGHLAAMLALRPNVLLEQGLPEGGHQRVFPHGRSLRPIHVQARFCGEFPALYGPGRRGSPVTHVAGEQSPVYISIGEKDNPPLIPQASQMADALTGQGSHVEFLCMIDCDHFQMNLQAGDQSGRVGPHRAPVDGLAPGA